MLLIRPTELGYLLIDSSIRSIIGHKNPIWITSWFCEWKYSLHYHVHIIALLFGEHDNLYVYMCVHISMSVDR